ncbi:MAG: TIGR03960 family B12-binding radical SAM protein [Candidatus Syntrophosphaera sp.]
MTAIDIEPWLPFVAKPSRYIDHELNAARKGWRKVNFCLAYPDVYEVGFSHLGLKILYSILNGLENVMADRCYLPWLDMIAILRREGIPLFGLESRRPVGDFDLLGITLQSEITYSNVLELLDLAGIPILAGDREEGHPIVIAGGPCVSNPLPLSDFIDAFFIGEAEEAIQEIARIFLNTAGRRERLAALAEVEGCYVPEYHRGKIPGGYKVKARKFMGFSSGALSHSPQLLPWQLATHNRCVAEIMRGCSRGCRFCHAGYFYRPVRERPAEKIVEGLKKEISTTGWDEAGLLSLSSSDYSRLKEVLKELLSCVDTDKTHISLPSLRVDTLDAETVDMMSELGREGLTIAPEAGTQRLRDIINKNLSEEDILSGVKTALDIGWQRVKLYFMIGLPGETDEDIDGIIGLIEKILMAGRKRIQINVTLSPFIPKPFTPFQWAPMLPAAELLRRCLRVKQAFSHRHQVRIKYHTIENSLLEAVFSRGDEKVSRVILRAWELGARFDGWNECFDFGIWEKAFEQCGIEPRDYLRERNVAEKLPWDFVDTGIDKGFLAGELEKARLGETTPDCREFCTQCGVCDESIRTVNAPREPLSQAGPLPREKAFYPQSQERFRYRVYYSKTGILRFISHLDWMRMLFRLISKAPLRVVYTQGFSPHPKVSLCPPLPLGVESEREFFDVSFHQPHTPDEITSGFSQSGIPQFRVLECEPFTGKAAAPSAEWIRIVIPDEYSDHVKKELAAFESEAERIFTKTTQTRSKSYDLKKVVLGISWQQDDLIVLKSLASPALFSVLSALFALEAQKLYQFRLIRSGWQF